MTIPILLVVGALAIVPGQATAESAPGPLADVSDSSSCSKSTAACDGIPTADGSDLVPCCTFSPGSPGGGNDSPGSPGGGNETGSSTTSKRLLREENVTVAPSQDVPPADVNGTETPDHNGTEPVPTPGVGERVATVTVRDDAGRDAVCVDVTPEGGGAVEVACVGRDRLGPAEPHVPRGDTEVLYLGEDDTPDVNGTPPQEVPDVPPVPGGSLGSTPHVTVGLDASYRYDGGRLHYEGTVLGHDAWGPAGPGEEAWYLLHGDDVGLTVAVAVYEDGEHVATVPVFVPYLGQALAAAEKTAGTL